MINTYFYSNPNDGGQSILIRKALKEAGIKFFEINPFSLMPENRQLIKHRLSVVPCVIIEYGNDEIYRISHRIENGLKTEKELKNLFISKTMKEAIAQSKKLEAIYLDIQKQSAERLGFQDEVEKKESQIEILLSEIEQLQETIEMVEIEIVK